MKKLQENRIENLQQIVGGRKKVIIEDDAVFRASFVIEDDIVFHHGIVVEDDNIFFNKKETFASFLFSLSLFFTPHRAWHRLLFTTV